MTVPTAQRLCIRLDPAMLLEGLLLERLARGELVTGRHEPGRGWDRRFNRQDGAIDLEAPPPPPLPSKDD